ncbi:MAG: polysaccharide pyruvyl transferase family protein [Lachnospiraceae bacterium]
MSNIHRVIITGGWGYGNIGDEAILRYTYKDLKNVFPEKEIIVLSYNENETTYHHKLRSMSSVHKILKGNDMNIKKTYLNMMLSNTIPMCLNDYASMFDTNTVLIMAGGGYFNDHWKESFYSRLCEINIAKLKGAKVVIIGQTIGPFSNKKNRTLAKKEIEKVDFIDVRDETSYFLLRNLLNTEVHLSCDSVIRNGKENKSIPKNRVGIMYERKRPYTKTDTSKMMFRLKQIYYVISGKYQKFENQMCDLVRKIHLFYPRTEVYFLQSTAWHEDKVNLITSKSGADSIKYGLDINSYLEEISKCKLIITTNMHPSIIATSIGIPAITISHTYKIDDYMKLIELQELIVYDINMSEIKQKIDYCFNNYNNIEEQLIKNNGRLNEKLDDLYDRLKEL